MAKLPNYYKVSIDGLTVKLDPIYEEMAEVVRCKDCKYGIIDDADFADQYLCKHNGCDWNKGDHFCSYGERKEA